MPEDSIILSLLSGGVNPVFPRQSQIRYCGDFFFQKSTADGFVLLLRAPVTQFNFLFYSSPLFGNTDQTCFAKLTFCKESCSAYLLRKDSVAKPDYWSLQYVSSSE